MKTSDLLSMLRNMLMTLIVLLIFIALMLLALMVFQNRLLYFPASATLDTYAPDGMDIWPVGNETPNTQRLTPVLGLLAESLLENSVGTVVVFHGNAGHAGHRAYYAQMLAPAGMRVILAEYPGYGPRAGKTNETLLVTDAIKTIQLAHELYGDPVWVLGESLGAGVAASVAGQVPQLVQGVVLITPWNRLVDVAKHHYPFLPVKWILRSEYDSIASLANFDGPKMIVTAQRDTVVPAELGKDLHRNINAPKKLINIVGAGHNDWYQNTDGDFLPELVNWLRDPASLTSSYFK